ncbi:MAG: putative endopeptidase, partial [Bacteroidia bacterium]
MNKSFLLIAVLALAACGITSTIGSKHVGSREVQQNTHEGPVAFDTSYIDSTANPCENFYQYAIGGWMANNPVPETESRWMAFNILNEQNRQKLIKIVAEVSKNTKARKGSDEQMIRDFYNSGMDSAAIEAAGTQAIQPVLAEIDAASTVDDLMLLLGKLGPLGVGNPVGIYISADSKNSNVNVVYASQRGLNLPDRDYYLQDDAKFADIRSAYVKHINKMFELADQDANVGDRILALETKLADASWSRLENRDPNKRYNKKNFTEWDKSLKNIDLKKIVNARGFAAFDTIIVGQPSFYTSLDGLINEVSLADWKSYLKWNA